MWIPLLALAALCALLFVTTSFRVLREYERAIVFRLGRARQRPLGPGLVLMLPFGIDRAQVVDLRTKVIQIPTQEVITRDNISIGVDAVVYADVQSPADAVLRVEQYMPATLQLAATTLRSIIGRMELDEVLAKRAEINIEVQGILDARVEQWGIDITAVEIKDISLPAEMKRAMARQAEAERERRAKVIMSDGELQAAAKLSEAARLISSEPAALQLRPDARETGGRVEHEADEDERHHGDDEERGRVLGEGNRADVHGDERPASRVTTLLGLLVPAFAKIPEQLTFTTAPWWKIPPAGR